jgi:hypothetical protein
MVRRAVPHEASAGEVTVAALYVDPNGAYANLPGVEVWDEARDARLYDGPWPVVAHPPCSRWCAIAHLVERRYGYRVGDDGGTFAAALEAVRTFSGVLEHPAFSKAWRRYGLHAPLGRGGWTRHMFDPGWTAELDQHSYGHPARKRTWLYYIGDDPPPLRSQRAPAGLPLVSSFSYNRGARWHTERMRVRPGSASATPAAFRDVLLAMARSAARVEVVA